MARKKATAFDVADYLDSPAVIAEYLNEALRENDTALFMKALGAAARAKGMTDLSREIGVARESLYKSLSAEGRPEFATVLKSLNALGMRLETKAA